MIHYMEQRTDEWFDIKRGKVSASHMADVQAGGKGVTRRNYLMKIVCEKLTGKTDQNGYSNGHMERGIELEDDARKCYEFETGNDVEQVGFIDHPFIDDFGCSPDGLVGEEGMVEIKCQIPAVHIECMTSRETSGKYQKQMQAQMSCANRQWVDFVSYCPDMPPEMQLVIIRYHRDEGEILEINSAVVTFNDEVNALIKQLKEINQ